MTVTYGVKGDACRAGYDGHIEVTIGPDNMVSLSYNCPNDKFTFFTVKVGVTEN